MSKTIKEYFGLSDPGILLDCKKHFPNPSIGLEVIDSDQGVGIEVEVENHQLKKHANAQVWVLKGDGSLRNNGVEYITLPIAARWAPAALEDLLSSSLDNACCFGPRTSIHVHLDMQQYQTQEVMDVVLLYTMLEGLFYKFTGRGRIKNIYCVPVFDTSLLKGQAVRGHMGATTEVWSKYSGLNLVRLRDLGTLEFRHMHGTFDVRKISIWIRLLTKLCTYTQKMGTEHIRKLCLMGPHKLDMAALLTEIFDNDAQHLKYESFEDVRKGVDAVKLAFTSGKASDTFRSNAVEKRGAYFNKAGVN